jgi:hypothetical protein
VLLSVLVVLSLVVLISAAVLGIDRGVLSGMARADYARGLITYIFAVVTIGIAVALVLSALTSQNPAKKTDARFQRGKEVLSLLLGVFGTIVGFYFGSETIKANAPTPFAVSSMDLTPQPATLTTPRTVRAVVTGGTPPFRFGIGQGEEKVDASDLVAEGGWIVKEMRLAAPPGGSGYSIHLVVEDAGGGRAEQTAAVKVTP